MNTQATTERFENIPQDVAAKALATKKFTLEQLRVIDAKIYIYCVPDWSEDSWAKTWRDFRDVLSFVEEAN